MHDECGVLHLRTEYSRRRAARQRAARTYIGIVLLLLCSVRFSYYWFLFARSRIVTAGGPPEGCPTLPFCSVHFYVAALSLQGRFAFFFLQSGLEPPLCGF